MPRSTWLDTVNEAARGEGLAGPDARTRLLHAVSRVYPFPLRLVFRGLVVGRRALQGRDYIEVVPEGLCRGAYDALGGILVSTSRGLCEGSVVTVAVDIQDPSTYHLEPRGVLADLVEMKVNVAVEP